MIDKATVDRILSATDIVDVIGDFVTLKRKGVNYQACCPFHNEKTPSFVVSPAKGYYKCFGCGKGGSAVGFVMDHESISYPEALKYLAQKYGIPVQEKQMSDEQRRENDDRESMMAVNVFATEYFSRALMESREGQNIGLSYLRERGFSDVTIERFGLGYCPSAGDEFSIAALRGGHQEQFLVDTGLTIKRESGGYYDRFAGRVIFPVRSVSGRVIAFGGRTLRSDKKVAKYLNSPESKVYHKSNTLYGIDQARKAIVMNNRAILVEGYTDVIQLSQAGIENVVASSGTSLTVEQIRLISRFTKNITVIYDGDSAGIKASMRGIDLILAQGLNVRMVLLPEGDDPDSFARSRSTSELEDYILSHEENFISFKTNLLLGETGGDPLLRATVIKDIVESIAVIPDQITRAEFSKECSRLLDSDEQTIMREVERRHAFNAGGKEGLEYYNNSQKKEQYLARQSAHQPQDMPPDDAFFDGSSPKESSLFRLERELAAYLVKYGDMDFFFMSEGSEAVKMNVGRTIIEELEIDNIEMKDELSRNICRSYRLALDGGEDTSQNSFLNHSDPLISHFTVDILSIDDRYRPSQIWQRHDESVVLERDNLDVAVPKAIALYKLKIIDSIKADLVRQIASESDMSLQLEMLSKVGALDRSRRLLCEKFSRIL